MEKSKKELILVYNANSGFYNMIKDTLHKSISPSTYGCNLCGLTFGTIRMKPKWKKFIDNLNVPSKFYHRDQFYEMLKTHPHKIGKINFPAVFLKKNGKLSLLITSDEINLTKTLEELMDLIEKKISKI